jgi:glucose-6-phosphate isomerase
MSNFFAQADALVLGKSPEQCKADGVPSSLIPHKVFPGDRPSSMYVTLNQDVYL